MQFPGSDFEISRELMIGVVIGVVAVALLRALVLHV